MNWKHTGLDSINSSLKCYKPPKEWYAKEKERLGLTDDVVAKRYTDVTKKTVHAASLLEGQLISDTDAKSVGSSV